MDTRTPEQIAIANIEEVGPHHYQIIGLPDGQPLHIYVLGCQGEEGERQKEVARIMNEAAEKKRPCIILFLGDNIYGGAVQSTTDERFKKRYDDVYNPEHLSTVPGILVLGNHDANLENWTSGLNYTAKLFTFGYYTPYSSSKDVEKFEVAHTYLQKNPDFYKENTLPINEMPKWNMPYYYSSYHFVGTNTQLFCLNSNSYVRDFMTSLSADSTTSNQAAWFKQGFQDAKNAGRATLVAMHNPLVTASKRALPGKYDAHLYLEAKHIQQMNYLLEVMATNSHSHDDLKALLKTIQEEKESDINTKVAKMPTNGSYADMLHACFRLQEIKPDTVFTAHDHALVYNQSDDLCQVISGTGGSTNLMKQMDHKNDSTMGCFIDEPGFVAVTCDASHPTPDITFEYHTTTGRYLQFTNKSHVPVISREPETAPAAAAAASMLPKFS